MILIFFKNNKRYIKLFLIIVLPAVIIYLIASLAVTMSLMAASNRVGTSDNGSRPVPVPFDTKPNENNGGDLSAATPAPTDEPESALQAPAHTNFMLVALDQTSVLTDVIMVGCFYRDTGDIRLMSIPRDTYIKLSEERQEEMRAEGLHPPETLKINELRSWGGQTHGVQFLMDQLGEMLGVHFRYYAEVEIPAFRKIVDILGGVDIELPSALHYSDPVQDLYIDLPAGMQHLDGEMAEQLGRFRSYPMGALGREAVHMQFMRQLLSQALQKETIMKDPLGIAEIILNDVRHNIGVEDIVKYVQYLPNLSGDKITTYTFPGTTPTINGISYVLPDEDLLADAVQTVFYAEEETPETDEPRPSHGLKIQVLNGSRVAGLGSSLADTLTADGYTVADTDVQTSDKQNQTQILVKADGIGEDLVPYFKNAAVETDKSIPDEYDIVIILGQGEN